MDEARFKEALLDAVGQCRSFGYNPSLFTQMIHQRGAVEAVRALLRPGPPSEGFARLVLAGRLDLCAEALALHPHWRGAFTDDELAVARQRLDELGYRPPWEA